jgi:hypothetical protein
MTLSDLGLRRRDVGEELLDRNLLRAAAAVVAAFLMRSCSSSAIFSASRAFLTTLKPAPLSGVPDQPMTRTGVAGGASLRFLPWSSNIARTLA